MFPEVGVGLVTRVDCLHLPRVGHGVGVAPAELHLLPASLISVFCGAFNSIVTSCSQSVPLFGVCGVSAASSHLRLMRVGSACLAHHPTSGSYRLNKGLGAGLATIAAWLAFTLGLGGVPPSLLGATSLDVIRVYRRCVSRHGSILDLHAHRCSMLVTALTSCPVCRVA